MAVTSGSAFVLNIVELQNVVTSASGLGNTADLQTSVAQLQEMVNYNNKSIAVNTISKFNQTPIQVTDPINFSTVTVNGSNVSGSSITNGAVSIATTNTSNAGEAAIQFTVGSGPAMTIYGDGHAVFNSSVTATSFITASDARLKTNVEPLTDSLAKVEGLRGVSYEWLRGGREIGFIAQEVHKEIPEAVHYDGALYLLEPTRLIPHLVEAVKALSARVTELEASSARVTELEACSARVKELERKLAA
jgi:hypothetical protein